MRRAPKLRAILAGAALTSVIATSTAASQDLPGTSRGPHAWAAELGVVRGSPFVEDGNGVAVRGGLGAFVGAHLAMRASDGAWLTAGLRASTVPVRVETSAEEWRPGRSQRYDLHLGAELEPVRSLRLGVSAFAGLLTGPADVVPFRRGDGRVPVWGAAMAGFAPIARDPDIELLIGFDLARLGSQRHQNPPLDGGWVGRLHAGLRHAPR